MHVDEVLCHGENGGTTWDTSHRGCIMRKVISKEVTAGGRFDLFWTLGLQLAYLWREFYTECTMGALAPPTHLVL